MLHGRVKLLLEYVKAAEAGPYVAMVANYFVAIHFCMPHGYHQSMLLGRFLHTSMIITYGSSGCVYVFTIVTIYTSSVCMYNTMVSSYDISEYLYNTMVTSYDISEYLYISMVTSSDESV